MLRIVHLERDSIPVTPRRPECPHEWVEYPGTALPDIVSRLQGAQVAIVNKLPVDKKALEALPDLQMIAEAATGCDNIDLQTCRDRGVLVCNVPGYALHAVSEHTLMLMLALRRNLSGYMRDIRDGAWGSADNFCLFSHPVQDLYGATLGIIGGGVIGHEVARLAEAFGMKTLFADHKGAQTVREGYVAFERVLREADIVSLHCPLSDVTRNLIGCDELALMKKSALLINTARGGLVDEQALMDALQDEVIGGAGVDVLSVEPPRNGNPLLAARLDNLLITPHIAWASQQAMTVLTDQLIGNIEAFAAGTPRNRVA